MLSTPVCLLAFLYLKPSRPQLPKHTPYPAFFTPSPWTPPRTPSSSSSRPPPPYSPRSLPCSSQLSRCSGSTRAVPRGRSSLGPARRRPARRAWSPRPGVAVAVAARPRRAVGLLRRSHAPCRGQPAGHGAGAPGQRRLRRPPHQGRGAGAPLPPRHGLRPLRRLLARAAAHQLRVPLQPAQRVRDGPASCRHRRAHAAGPLGRAQRRGRHAARAPRGLPRPRHGHRVRRALRRRQPGGRGAGGDGEGRVRTTCSACSTGATTCRCSGGWTCKASGGGAGAW
jgi:hypothetical protein